eukprot:CAMPEP_0185411444 /NCGR_PEP_ID=MMETSP1365-20130426/3578_1 /TAXON_ID=38817 /ORGANISM="Gephyrocapsa oceanica, Strain RCC1303" /LENGTH=673 /DNA_ID=CAMNT_0028014065 /DNA_START=21 /DNA_END=2042 /DNA_ORIENTATION=-
MASPPHVLMILADDFGWANLGFHRRQPVNASSPEEAQARIEAHTPTLDALIDEGVLLNRHYAYKICSPSRSSLQSGRLAVHVNVVNTSPTVRNASDPVSGYAGIPRNMTTLATKLREGGYVPHMVGKWDAGMATPEHTPHGRGYESWLGYYQHANEYWAKGLDLASTGEIDICLNHFVDLSSTDRRHRGGVTNASMLSAACEESDELHPPCYEEILFRDRSLSIIHGHDLSNASAPLFLLHAFHLVHTPLQVPRAYLRLADASLSGRGLDFDDGGRRNYSAMARLMDSVTAELVGALRTRGMWERTLVVFTSDNGGPIYDPGSGNNHPLRGGKFSDFEGGVRVNAFVSGGYVPPASRGGAYEGVVSIADWYGLLCELAGVDPTDHAAEDANAWLAPRGLPLLHPVDSVRGLWSAIVESTAPGGASANLRPLLHISEQSVLKYPYKLIVGGQDYGTWTGPLYPNCTKKPWEVNGTLVGPKPIARAFKVFDQQIDFSKTPTGEAALTWQHDCGARGCLFDVSADPNEHDDLAPSMPEKAAELRADLATLNGLLFKPHRGDMDVDACYEGVAHGGFYGPFAGDLGRFYTDTYTPSRRQRVEDDAFKAVVGVVGRPAVQEAVIGEARAHAARLWQWADPDRCPTNGTRAGAMMRGLAERVADAVRRGVAAASSTIYV